MNEMMALADNLVAGDIARRGHGLNDAIASYGKAVTIYDKLPYAEPRYWDYPARNPLGAALLEADNAKEAEAAFRESLKQWPDNGWTEFGLMKALETEHKTADAGGQGCL